MKSASRSERVARLSGFLYALSPFSGALRHHEGFAYCIEVKDQDRSATEVINDHYRGQHRFAFVNTQEVRIDRRALEVRIRPFLIRDDNILIADRVTDMRLYLSFRVMDMIEDIFGDDFRHLDMLEIACPDLELNGGSTFFCARAGNLMLVIQFNHRQTLGIDHAIEDGSVG